VHFLDQRLGRGGEVAAGAVALATAGATPGPLAWLSAAAAVPGKRMRAVAD